jgi:FPC/CPF motif-containing protein YcgG
MGGISPEQSLCLYAARNPFVSAAALQTSNYSAGVNGTLVRLLDSREPSGIAKMVHQQLRSFLSSERFDSGAANAAMRSGDYRFGFYEGFPRAHATQGLARDLAAFAAEMQHADARPTTFLAVFGDRCANEAAFARQMQAQLRALRDVDPSVFSYSKGGLRVGTGRFSIVGMHPGSLCISRRFALPTIAFNPHERGE